MKNLFGILVIGFGLFLGLAPKPSHALLDVIDDEVRENTGNISNLLNLGITGYDSGDVTFTAATTMSSFQMTYSGVIFTPTSYTMTARVVGSITAYTVYFEGSSDNVVFFPICQLSEGGAPAPHSFVQVGGKPWRHFRLRSDGIGDGGGGNSVKIRVIAVN